MKYLNNREECYMEKYFFTLIGSIAVLSMTTSVFAAPAVQLRKEIREEKKASVSALKSNITRRAVLSGVVVIGKGIDTITVTGTDGKTYSVKTDRLTQWQRKFWGKSDIGETNNNDILNIHGKWNNEEMSEIQATFIRNLSVQKRHGVFFGTVTSLSSNGWTMTTAHRGDQTVLFSSAAQLVDRKQMGIVQSSIGIGHRIRVKGLWDSVNNTITEVTQVKDFTLPAVSTP